MQVGEGGVRGMNPLQVLLQLLGVVVLEVQRGRHRNQAEDEDAHHVLERNR